jgi:Protein of unknown function (DUF1592)/Protein of unknown function (DUF1588)/Protein of unknown function (DUF1595)/Protein of unknown function (DUF1585)
MLSLRGPTLNWLAVSSCVLGLGCTGNLLGSADGAPGASGLGGASAAGGASNAAGSGGVMVPPAGTQVQEGAGLMPLRRLGQREHARTVTALFGAGVISNVTFPDDERGASSYATPTVVGAVERDRFEQAADALAKQASPQLDKLAPCPANATAAVERTCAQTFVTDFGKKVFRRPLVTAEADALLALYDQVRAAPISYSQVEALQTLLSALLQSPQFLYHWELGSSTPVTEGQFLRLNGYEIASRLSYFLWASMPDDELFAAAAAGTLDNAAGVQKEVERLLQAPAAAYVFTDMVGQWIGIEKLAGLVKDPKVASVDATLRDAMRDNFEAFTADTLHARGSYQDLLTSPNGFVTGPLASLYGLPGSFGAQPTRAALPNGRVGLFSQAAFLALEALPQEGSPVRRGKLVANRLLCREIAPPPVGLDVTPPMIPDGVQTREAYAQHSTDATCGGCHSQMDPLGFAFEHFDTLGRYRDTEANKPIDATGTIHDLDGAEVPFNGVAELMAAIAKSNAGQACFVRQLALYALNRSLGDFDVATTTEGLTAFKAGALDVRKLVPAIAGSKSFRYRVPAAGEVIQ